MPRLLRKQWWKELVFKLSIAIPTKAFTPWFLVLGAGIISGFSYGFERLFLNYRTLPADAQVLIPVLSAALGVSLVLALTLYFREKNLFSRTGFRRAFPVRAHAEDAQDHSKRHLENGVAEIRRVVGGTPGAGECRLLLVSGFYYLGAPSVAGSPGHLRDLLGMPTRVRILLLNPFQEMCTPRWWAGQRAGEGDKDPRRRLTPAEYAGGIKRVCHHLATLRDEDHLNIDFGFYNFWPSWQLFLSDREGIVQPVAVGLHAQYNPMYLFQYTKCSLFVPFQRYFEVLWQRWTDHRDEFRSFYKAEGVVGRHTNVA